MLDILLLGHTPLQKTSAAFYGYQRKKRKKKKKKEGTIRKGGKMPWTFPHLKKNVWGGWVWRNSATKCWPLGNMVKWCKWYIRISIPFKIKLNSSEGQFLYCQRKKGEGFILMLSLISILAIFVCVFVHSFGGGGRFSFFCVYLVQPRTDFIEISKGS